MKKEKKVRTYQRRTKSGKMVTVRAHTASYEAAEKAKEAAKKKGAGEELSSKVKKGEEWKLPMDEFLKKLKEERAQKRDEESEKVENEKPKESEKKTEKKTTKKRTVGTGTNGPEPKKKTTTKKTAAKADTSEPAFTAAEFKEWYRGTGSDADKKVAKALRAQLGRAGYRKLEDEAIDNYSSRGHLSMFKRVSGGSEVSAKTSKSNNGKASTAPKGKDKGTPVDVPDKSTKSKISSTTGDYHKSVVNRAIKYALTDVDKAKDYMDRRGVDPKHQEQILAGNYEVSPERGKEGFIRVGIKESQRPYVSSDNELIRNPHRKRPLTITLPREKKNVHSKSSASSFMDGYKDMNALREYASQVMDEITPYKAKTRKELKRMFDADQGNDGSHEKAFKKFLKDEWLPNKDNVQGNRNFYLGIKTPKKVSKPTLPKNMNDFRSIASTQMKEYKKQLMSAIKDGNSKKIREARKGYMQAMDDSTFGGSKASKASAEKDYQSVVKALSKAGYDEQGYKKRSVGTGTNGPEPKKFTESQLRAYGRKLANTRNKYVGGHGPDYYRRALKKRQEALAEYHKTDEGKAMRSAYRSYTLRIEKQREKEYAEKRKAKEVEDAKRILAKYGSK